MNNQSILVTGGSGSLGSALCHHYQSNPPNKLVALSRDWLKQAKLKQELGNPEWMRFLLGDVRDKDRLYRAFRGIDTVIHTAAIKDVVSSERDPNEAVLTNVIGTQNVIDAAIDCGVKKVLVISTDKAVEGLNCYGRTKALAESLAIASNSYARGSDTRISVARYGNVFASSGSVVPLFIEQAKTGKLTITDKRMTRFFITMPDAIQFIMDCLDAMHGGEIFIPKMKSARVTEIAEAIAPDAELVEIGIRPGEKLHETLIINAESVRTYDTGKFYIIAPGLPFWDVSIDGEKVPDGFMYSSDTNQHWLRVNDLRGMLRGLNDTRTKVRN